MLLLDLFARWQLVHEKYFSLDLWTRAALLWFFAGKKPVEVANVSIRGPCSVMWFEFDVTIMIIIERKKEQVVVNSQTFSSAFFGSTAFPA